MLIGVDGSAMTDNWTRGFQFDALSRILVASHAHVVTLPQIRLELEESP